MRVPSHDAQIGREGAWTTASYSQADVTTGSDFVVVAERRGQEQAYVAVDTSLVDAPTAAQPVTTHPAATHPASVVGHFALRASADLPSSAQRPMPVRADRGIVLDVSYSQSAATVRAQAALALAIVSELEPEEGFVLLACDSACAVHPSPAGPLEARVEQARRFLGDLAPGGASDLAGALVAGTVELGRLAAREVGKGRQLTILTDGQASAGELSPVSIARVASQHTTPSNIDLRLVGVGRKIDRDQLENLAIELDAALDYLPSAADLEVAHFEIAIGLRQPVVRSARVALPAGWVLTHGSQIARPALGPGGHLDR